MTEGCETHRMADQKTTNPAEASGCGDIREPKTLTQHERSRDIRPIAAVNQTAAGARPGPIAGGARGLYGFVPVEAPSRGRPARRR
jgi:hypothetical protein